MKPEAVIADLRSKGFSTTEITHMVAERVSATPMTRKERDMATNLMERNGVEALKRIKELEDELNAAKALLSQRPAEPSDDQAVIRFRKYSTLYSYAAIKVGRRWFLTQSGDPQYKRSPKAWDELLDWIGETNWHTIEVLS